MKRWFVLAGIATAGLAATTLAAPGDVARVSVSDTGAESPTGGFRGVASGSGNHVLFLSAADLAGTPTGGKVQLYMRDLTTGRTRLVSTSATGAVADQNVSFGDPFNPAIDVTPDGRYVVFASVATNLVPGDANAQEDVFRKDMTTGAVDLVSVSSAGAQGNNVSRDPSVSGDGTRVAFVSIATNLLPTDGNAAASDILLRDLAAGTTTLVSVNTAGQQANEFTERPSISADGRAVAFEAGPLTTNLYVNDTNAANDILVRNLSSGVTTPAAVKVGAATLSGADVLGGSIPDISGDGRYVVFQTGQALDPLNDTNMAGDVYRRDVVLGVTSVVSARNGLGTADGADSGTISADGARAAFISTSANLVAGDTNAMADAFARTFAGQSTVRMSQLANGTQALLGWETAGISGNGARGVYTGQGTLIGAADANAADDVYATELAPTDATGPTLTAQTVAGATGGKVRIGGTVTDPSGVARLTVGGTPVSPGNGAFSVDVAPGGSPVPVVAMDGAGNTSTVAVVVSRVTGVVVSKFPRKVTLRFVLAERARVTTTLQRAVRKKNGKIGYVNVRTTKAVNLNAGTRTLSYARPRRGVYRIKLTATFTSGKQVVNAAFIIRK